MPQRQPVPVEPIPLLYLAPWVDLGGSDKGTIDWFRWIDRRRVQPILATTQPSANRRFHEILPYAQEAWALPELMAGAQFPEFVLEVIASRGVRLVHIMNSRLGFDLLPDLKSLPDPPKVVVQLHVEEQDKSGYVRYVTTRYGNLVDAFSVTSKHLAAAVAAYEVPRSRIHVIRTGVDVEEEFSPHRVLPQPLDSTGLRILYPGRLVEQKDPLLMVDVVERLVPRLDEVTVHVVGEGPLEQKARHEVARRGLERWIRFEGPSTELASWYAACDAVLMTSAFEGVPYTMAEAMAMGLPVVAPALPGNRELAPDSELLIDPRDNADAYAQALARLGRDRAWSTEIGAAARRLMQANFSVEEMARRHEDLYAQLLAGEERASAPPEAAPHRVPRFRRASRDRPLVTTITPCFNHGRYLRECLASIFEQTYPHVEIVVVDDASTDSETQDLLTDLEGDERVTVVRQPVNSGPSAARNRALDVARGRYFLPVDSDNLLLPNAIEKLVAFLQTSPEDVGFVYPNLQYFGNRDDYFEPPDYNPYLLLDGNYCDTCSLFDRRVFDAGVRFAEDIRLGHEDWDLVLQMAARGIRGRAMLGPTVLYRKRGFTRSDLVEYRTEAFQKEIRRRHPQLFADESLKPRWMPGLSVVALRHVDTAAVEGRQIAQNLSRQTLQDIELLVCHDGSWPSDPGPRMVRRMPPALGDDPAELLALLLPAARSRLVLLLESGLPELLTDPSGLEKVLRIRRSRPELEGVVLADAADPIALRAIGDPGRQRLPHGLLLDRRRVELLPRTVTCHRDERPIDALVKALSATEALLDWRSAPAGDPAPPVSRTRSLLLRPPPPRTGREAINDRQSRRAGYAIPGAAAPKPRRWTYSESWMPPETWPLVRHRDPHTGKRVITNDRTPPADHVIEYDLGVVQRFAPPGTMRLQAGGATFEVVRRGSSRPPLEAGVTELGHVEQAPLPLWDPLVLARHPNGQDVLVAGADDPIATETEGLEHLGWIEAYPIQPRVAPMGHKTRHAGFIGLVSHVDPTARRHMHATVLLPKLELVGELGALFEVQVDDLRPLWISRSGRVSTEEYQPTELPARSLRQVFRWALAPVGWRGFGHVYGRGRAVARRLLEVPIHLRDRRFALPEDPPAGYVATTKGEGLIPLVSGLHPITGDQALAHSERSLTNMGYAEITHLGFLRDLAPTTGSLVQRLVPVPWASRFGFTAHV